MRVSSSVFSLVGQVSLIHVEKSVFQTMFEPGMAKVTSLLPAELLHQRLVIEGRTDLTDFALCDVKGVDAWQCYLPAARWHTAEFSLVGPSHRGEAGNLFLCMVVGFAFEQQRRK